MPYKDKRKSKNIAFSDPHGLIRAAIERVIDGHHGVTVSEFVRNATIDRLDEIREAEARVAQERAARVRIAGVPMEAV